MNYNLSHFDRSYRSLIFLNTQYFYYFDLNKVNRLHNLIEKKLIHIIFIIVAIIITVRLYNTSDV